MCGLAGIIGKKVSSLEKHKVLNSILHRGPNSSGVYSDKDTTFIHARLSILDISNNGNQPMIDKKTGTIILYNGEIYNFKELKIKELNNFKFASNTDTEVILNLYIKFGIKFVNKLEGMFAISIWDPRIKKLYLIRDRFGIKPLFYYHKNKILAFSSEIKPIFNFNIKSELNFENLKKYLLYGMLATSKSTLFNDICSVPSGSILTFHKNKIFISKYWNLKDNFSSRFNKLNEKEIEEETFFLMKKVIKEHLISDVPVGICLSSGSDSQVILNCVIEENLKKIECFTYGFNETKYNEIEKLKYLKKDKKQIFNSSILNPFNLINDLEKSISDFECPIGGLGTLGLWKLMKKAKKRNIPVLLSGEGADEAFCGYKYYYYFFLLELYKNKQYDLLNKEVKYLKYDQDITEKIDKKFFNKLDFNSVQAPDGSLLKDESFLINKNKIKFYTNNEFDNIHMSKKTSPLKSRIFKDLFFLKIPKLLWFVDRASMASGIECRVPFLDRRIIEHCFSLPSNLLIKNGINKYLIKNFLTKKFRQKDVKKKKLYVATPQREWIKSKLRNKVLEYIKKGYLVDRKIIDYKLFKNHYERYSKSKKLGNSFKFWKILNAEIFCKTFF